MFRKAYLLIALICVLANCTPAEFSTAKLLTLDQELQKLIAPYGYKVGACFIDLESGGEIQINASKKFPAASVAKLPVLATVYHMAGSGKLNLDERIKFKERDKLPGSGVLQWMKPGNEYSVRNLARLMIVLSDNTATKMLVDQVSLDEINRYLQKLGLNDTRVVDSTLLREPPQEYVNLTTPEDMARLCALLQDPEYFDPKFSQEMLGYMHRQKYRWGIWKGVPKGVKIANKTGNLEGVLNDVGIVYSPAGKYILSVFTHGFSEKKNARELINKISETVYAAYTGADTGYKN
jgi:beta-lactamase class A